MPRSPIRAVPWMTVSLIEMGRESRSGVAANSFWEMPGLWWLWDLRGVPENNGSPDKYSALWYKLESLAQGHESKPVQGEGQRRWDA